MVVYLVHVPLHTLDAYAVNAPQKGTHHLATSVDDYICSTDISLHVLCMVMNQSMHATVCGVISHSEWQPAACMLLN